MTTRPVLVAIGLMLLTGCVAATEPVEPRAHDAVDRLRTAKFPATYAFTYRPLHQEMGVLECFTGPNGDLEGWVDEASQAMEVRFTSRDGTLVVRGDRAFAHRSLVPIPDAHQWLSTTRDAPAGESAALASALGPGLASFAVPPRLPNDPNTTAAAAIEAARSVRLIGSEDINGGATDHLRIVTDPTKARDAAATSASGAQAPGAAVIDAWVDTRGFVVRLEAGTPDSTGDERDTSSAAYRMDFAFPPQVAIPIPDPATALPAAQWRPSAKDLSFQSESCAVSVDR